MHLPTYYKQEERHGLKQLSAIVIKKTISQFFIFFEKVGKNIVNQPLTPEHYTIKYYSS